MDTHKIIELIDSNSEKAEKVIDEKVTIWSQHVLFSDLWWLGVGLTIIPWIVWFIVRPKQSTDRILYVGLMVMAFSLVADVLGDQFSLWHYRFNVIPILPTYVPWDLSLMPVSVMLFLQIKPRANPYLKALLYAVITSYVAEPFFHWLEIYFPKNWRYTFSVPIQYGLYLAAYNMLHHRNQFEPMSKYKGVQ